MNGFAWVCKRLLLLALVVGMAGNHAIAEAADDAPPDEMLDQFQAVAAKIDALATLPDSEMTHTRVYRILGEISFLTIVDREVSRADFEYERSLKVRLFLELLLVLDARVDHEFDPHFDEPPLRFPEGMLDVSFTLGGDLDRQLKDHPEILRKYKEMVRDHREKRREHGRRGGLLWMYDRMISHWAPRVIRSGFEKSSLHDERELERLLKKEIKDEELREQLVKALEAWDNRR